MKQNIILTIAVKLETEGWLERLQEITDEEAAKEELRVLVGEVVEMVETGK